MNDQETSEVQRLRARVEYLEKMIGLDPVSAAAGFDPMQFQRIMGKYVMICQAFLLPVMLLSIPLLLLMQGYVSEARVGDIPFINCGPGPTLFGLPVGIISMNGGAIGAIAIGGLAIGVLAIGGGAFGVIAIGGGAIGLIAFGGGAIGVFALGGGAIGYIALGGGAFGYYVLAGDGLGKHVFSRRRQDEEAVRFFCHYLPGLRQAFKPSVQ